MLITPISPKLAQSTSSVSSSVANVTRELMYRANWYSDEWISSTDVAGGSKLGAALLQLAGKRLLSERGVQELVATYAGADQRVGVTERARLLDDVARITRALPSLPNPVPWPEAGSLGVQLRWFMTRGDVDFDGRIGAKDAALGSAWAGALLTRAKATGSLDVADVERFARTRVPNDDPLVSFQYLMRTLRDDVVRHVDAGQNVLDLARASLRVYDDNQDLRLELGESRSATGVVRMLGADARTPIGVDEIAATIRPFDTHGIDGSSGADGRLSPDEFAAYQRVLVAAAKQP